jgi:hypothetical protein
MSPTGHILPEPDVSSTKDLLRAIGGSYFDFTIQMYYQPAFG